MKENYPPNLQEAALDLYEACKAFVAKVESEQARSVRSYAQMKAAIAKADGLDGQDTLSREIGPALVSSQGTP